jgi:hypothetical protein
MRLLDAKTGRWCCEHRGPERAVFGPPHVLRRSVPIGTPECADRQLRVTFTSQLHYRGREGPDPSRAGAANGVRARFTRDHSPEGCKKTVSLDQLANPADLRAFIHAMSDITGASVSTVLKAIVEVLERQLCVRSDDKDEVWRPGRLHQVVRVESDAGPYGRARS